MTINRGLQIRQDKINNVKGYLQETERLFTQFGSNELHNVKHKFEDIEKALSSAEEVKLVVIGEFSRGKSTLVNALLDIQLLRSAQEATTAINTFVRKLPETVTQRLIRIHFQDGRTPQDIEWKEGDSDTLEKWGTELEASHADARKLIDRIEIFTPHSLLEQGLVLIDTPGLQAVIAHHEGITRRAIDEAHIAIWVQSTQQLGGNATEWKFLSNTIRKNFNKFLTVVNMWDSVLEPNDHFDKKKPLHEREAQKYGIIRKNFEINLPELPAEDLAQMTSEQYLMGVSALWALSADEEQKKRSGIDRLSNRISEMLSNGEALEQIYKKPLQALTAVQLDLIDSVQNELGLLGSDQTIEERRRDSEALDTEIKLLVKDLEYTNRSAKIEHDNAANALIDELQRTLISPLQDIKTDIDQQVTPLYVEGQIAKRVERITLPNALQQQYEQAIEQVNQDQQTRGNDIEKLLADLRTDYAEQLEKHAGNLQQKIGNIHFTLPTLDMKFDIDFSELNKHAEEQDRLNAEIATRQAEIHQLEIDATNNAANPEALTYAQQAMSRAERAKENLGGRPSVREVRNRREVPRDWVGWLGFTKTVVDVSYDDSTGKRWDGEYSQAQTNITSKEAMLEQIQRQEIEKSGKRLNAERAIQRAELEFNKLEKQRQKADAEADQKRKLLIEETRQQLINATSGTLSKLIRQLQDQVRPHIQDLFNAQLELLQQQVQAQLQEPLNAKLEQRKNIEALIQQGTAEIEKRRSALQQGVAELQSLLAATHDNLNDA